MKTFFIYKTTNTVTSKYYIGMHVEKRPDGYLGSGKRLRRSISKHGRHNHTREILEYCSSWEELVKREEEIITDEILADPLCMNIRLGGKGGGKWTVEQQKENNRRGLERQRELASDPIWVARRSANTTRGLLESYSNGSRVPTVRPHDIGWQHSEETKATLSTIGKTWTGEKNSQFGTFWITNGVESKKIKPSDIIPDGWVRGRKQCVRSSVGRAEG